jgi:acylpyruvate hydrolase
MSIRNIWCVGRNYADHAKELGNEVPKEPLFFLKAGSSATVNSSEIVLPSWSEEIHHEVELAFRFDSSLKIKEAALALDLTERRLQSQAKKNGGPWTLSKSFSGACAVTAFFPVEKSETLSDLQIRLWVNEELKQDGRTSQMIFKFDQLINYVLKHFPVCPGDLLLTGTPAGVGPIKQGDQVRVQLETQLPHTWKVQKESS